MNLKNAIITVLFLVIFITSPAHAELEIVLDKLSPQPAEPGQDLAMSITLANEFSDIDDVRLTIVPDSPIILKNENDRTIYFGRIIKYGAKAETYLLHIDSHANSGTYEIKFEAHWSIDGQQREMNKTVNVMVRGVPQLLISNISITPELISPQDTFNVAFSVSNEGTGIARETQVTAATGGLPFVPVGSDTNIIKNIDPGESFRLDYRMLVKDKTEITSYSIPIRMDYKDENGKNISSQNLIGVKVLGRAKLSIANIKIDPQNPTKGDLVTLNMRIENSGTGDARSVKVILETPFKGSKTAFLGKIKPNDDAPGVFTFYAAESGDIPYSAKIEFEDDLGIHANTEVLNLTVQNANKSSMVPISMILVVIGASIFYLYRRKKM
ncbi:MAG: hypothetical protein FIB08_12390 [Candidatus Methanoperedens sp.]|nr:hypothetical protein [Candidatus Methanoperedens sp.]